jgi:hypothetical protein
MGTNPESVKSGRIITNDIIKCIFSQLANEDILMKTIFHDLLRDDSDKEELVRFANNRMTSPVNSLSLG